MITVDKEPVWRAASPTAKMVVTCKCGNQLTIDHEGWTINFIKGVEFKCQCGEVHSLGFMDR